MKINLKPNMTVGELLQQLDNNYSVLTLNGNIAGENRKLRALTETPERLASIELTENNIEENLFNSVGIRVKAQNSSTEGSKLQENKVDSELNETYFDIYLNHIYEQSIDEKYKLKLSKNYFTNLSKYLNFIEITFANSEEAIDEFGGDDYYRILFDVKNHQILPINYYELKHSTDSQEIIFNAYTGSNYADIPLSYIENEDYWGTWSISNMIEGNDWEIYFHGEFEYSDGDVKQDLLNEVKETINSKEILSFIQEVITRIKSV